MVQIDWRGQVSSVGGAAYAANSELVKRQLEFQNNGYGFEFSKWLILKKTGCAIVDNRPLHELKH